MSRHHMVGIPWHSTLQCDSRQHEPSSLGGRARGRRYAGHDGAILRLLSTQRSAAKRQTAVEHAMHRMACFAHKARSSTRGTGQAGSACVLTAQPSLELELEYARGCSRSHLQPSPSSRSHLQPIPVLVGRSHSGQGRGRPQWPSTRRCSRDWSWARSIPTLHAAVKPLLAKVWPGHGADVANERPKDILRYPTRGTND